MERALSLFQARIGPRNVTPAVCRAAVSVAYAGAAVWILAQPWAWLASWGNGRLQVTFIDVGQGDATLVRFPRGASFLVDAGGLGGSPSFDIGDRVVAPVLRWLGVRRLETLVLTHGDADHIGGAGSIVHEFTPHNVWEGIPVPPFEPLQALRAVAQRGRSRWVNVQTADRMTIDGVELVVHHPGLPDWERQEVRNDDSVVLELRWGDVSIVLPGDICREGERTIAARFARTPLRIVKIPHHGSLSSSTVEFIRALQPRAAIASAGRSNPFGHPAPLVLRRYQDAGAEIFRTDQDGAVMLETDGKHVVLRTFTRREVHLLSSVHHEDTKSTKERYVRADAREDELTRRRRAAGANNHRVLSGGAP
jgi:competence protein ComEC